MIGQCGSIVRFLFHSTPYLIGILFFSDINIIVFSLVNGGRKYGHGGHDTVQVMREIQFTGTGLIIEFYFLTALKMNIVISPYFFEYL